MTHLSLSSTVLVEQDIVPQLASANVQGAVVDMQGWDGCMYTYNIGAMASGGTFTATIFNSANANMSGNTVVNSNVTGTVVNANVGALTNASNTNLYIVDVWRPTTRYLQNLAQPGTANTTFGCLATRYRRTGILPPTQSAASIVAVAAN